MKTREKQSRTKEQVRRTNIEDREVKEKRLYNYLILLQIGTDSSTRIDMTTYCSGVNLSTFCILIGLVSFFNGTSALGVYLMLKSWL